MRNASSIGEATISLIVTGASRGFGRAVAIAFGEHFGKSAPQAQLKLLLVARDKQRLMRTKSLVPQNDRLVVSHQILDLSDYWNVDNYMDEMLEFWKIPRTFGSTHRCIFINNAGSLGHIGACHDMPGPHVVEEAVDLNITNPLWASARVAQFADAATEETQVTLVNVSSLLALKPIPSLALYCATKAAREAFHVALAQEGTERLRVLNYAPGPMKTDMTKELMNNPATHEDARPSPPLLDPLESARVLMQLLDEDAYAQGAHVDYFDCILKDM